MSQPPTRKRDKISLLFRSHSSQTTPAASASSPLAPSTTIPAPSPSAPAAAVEQPEKRYLEVLATLRTVFDLADSVCDGCQIWGPKAAFSTAAKGIKALQTTFENEGSIGDIEEAVQKTADLLARSMATLPSSVSPELQSRISTHTSELEEISASTAKWAKGEKHFLRRLFDAERVAKELEGVMSKIHAANERFLLETVVRTEVKIENLQDVVETGVAVVGRDIVDLRERDLLDRLRPVKEAFHNAPNASEMCLPGTRQQLLADLFAWFDDLDPSRERVFWLNGLAGTGKTTVARTIATRAHKQGRLAAAFFFSRNIAVTRSPSAILPTIAYQLADYQRLFRTAVCTAVSADEDVRDRGIATQADGLFSNLRGVTVPDTPLLIVLDALDECYLENGCEGGDAVPLLLAQFASVPSVKILITSRMEDTLKHMFDDVTNLALHNIEADIVQSDILHYLKHTLGEHARVRKLPLPFPTDDALHELVTRAGTLFIYAATVVKWVSDSKAEPRLRLQQVLDQDADEMAFQHKLLDGMYLQIIAGAAQTSGNPLPHERALAHVLSTVVLLQEPMKAPALASLAGEDRRASAILPLLSAVLLVDETAPVRLFHPSFPDFITDEGRCSDKRFLVMRAEGHLQLATRCLEIMNAGLRENICDLEDPSMLNHDVADLELRLEHAASPELRYACKYWHVHICLANATSPDLVKSLVMFCTLHLLHWVELLSLLGGIQRLIGSNSMRSLLTCLEGCEALRGSSVSILLSDIARLVAAYSTPILSHALHVYHSALTTMPSCLLQRCMTMARCRSDAPLLISERASGWGPEMKLMYDHKRVTSAAFSPDGRYLASGAEDGTIQIRDVALGAQPLVVQGDDSRIGSIAFSPDGQVIVSGSESSMIHVWYVSARTCRHAIGGHNGSVKSVAFSPDGRFVVSGSSDSTVRVWDVLTGEQQHRMRGHKLTVLSVAFSPDGHSVVSGSRDHTVRVWNALDGTQRSIIEGHADSVTCAAFSSDGRLIASGCAWTLRVWDVATGSQHYVSHSIHHCVRSVEFSPDSRSVVFIDGTQLVRVWDTSTSNLQTRTIWSDHAHIVHAVTSLPTLQVIVGGIEKPAVQVWEIGAEAENGEQHHTPASHTDEVWSVACSPDGQYIVSGSKDHTIRVWDTTAGAQRHVMSGHSAAVRWVAFSPNGEWIVSASWDHTIRVWDAATGAHHHTMEGHADEANVAAFSPNGQFIVSGSDDQTVRLWDATTGHPRHVMSGHDDNVLTVAFSQDGRLVASGSADTTVRLWDAAAGTQHRVMSGHTDFVWTVAFSPDGQFIVSGSRDETARVWDTTTGAQWRSVDHPFGVYSVEFQPDSRSIMYYDEYDIPARNAATGDPAPSRQQGMESQIADQQNATRPLFRHPHDGWIWRQNPHSRSWQRVCWLPSARRGYADAVLSDGQKVFMGGMDGSITILDFSHVKPT